jgi:hypothetical protein
MRSCQAIAKSAISLFGIAVGASSAWAALITGPTSPYFLDNFANQTIYVVQGTSGGLNENLIVACATCTAAEGVVALGDDQVLGKRRRANVSSQMH